MYDSENLPTIGPSTESEQKLTEYIGECIAQYIEKGTQVDRRELMAALVTFITKLICVETHFDIKGKLKEIDALCKYLKDCAKKDIHV